MTAIKYVRDSYKNQVVDSFHLNPSVDSAFLTLIAGGLAFGIVIGIFYGAVFGFSRKSYRMGNTTKYD